MAFRLAVLTQAILVTSIVAVSTWLYRKLYHKRFEQNAHIPQLPSSLLFGHLIKFDEYTKKGALDRHPDAMFSDMHNTLGRPPVMMVDNWPVVPPMAIIGDYEVAEQVSRASQTFPYSMPRSPSVEKIIDLIGANSILFKNYEPWRQVRKRFSPGFAHQHLMTLLPLILDKSTSCLNILDNLAMSGDTVSLDEITANLTFDIIGIVTAGIDMSAQHLDSAKQGEIIRIYKELIKSKSSCSLTRTSLELTLATAYANDKLQLPWWIIPRTHHKRHKLGKRLEAQLQPIVRRSFDEMKSGQSIAGSRSILSLSLQGIDSLTDDILAETCDQIKTFLFAGHDTTSTAISWIIYELTRTPHALKKVREELDRLFGPGRARDPQAICNKLLGPDGDSIVNSMTYISAVMKESLRMHSPAGTIRISHPGNGFSVKTSQGDCNLDGNWVYLNHNIMHYDRNVYGDDVNEFVPERWLQQDAIPASAWRPFERGPRNCIGQELATIEIRIIIALVAYRYEFTKIGLGEITLDEAGKPTLNHKNQYVVKSELYNTIQITGRPVDGMMMKVKMSQT